MDVKNSYRFQSNNDMKATNRVDKVTLTNGMSSETVVKIYNDWSGSYDKNDLKPGRYNGPMYAARYFHKHLSTRDNFNNMKILDVGAGSGRIAHELANLAKYNCIDALEPARTFFEASPYRPMYQNHICKFLGKDTLGIHDDTYDAIVSAGAFAAGHIPCEALTELVRIVKPGGLILIEMNNTFLEDVDEYRDRLEPFMQELEQHGKWALIEKSIEPNHFCSKDAVIFAYSVKEEGCVAFHSKVLS